jgi:hypothetical protein
MDKAKRAQTAETLKQPSLRLTSRAPYLYPDRAYSAFSTVCVYVRDVRFGSESDRIAALRQPRGRHRLPGKASPAL